MINPEAPNPITPEAKARIRELQGLITDSQRRADKAKDPDIREALNLQISKLGLKVARLQHGQPEDLPSEVEHGTEEEDVEPIPTPTAGQLEAADKLIQRARLEKTRGNKQAASDLLKQAVDTAPGAGSVLEALADDYAERKQYAAARDTYKRAHRADPNSPGIERKLAHLSMSGLADLSIEDHLRLGSLDPHAMQQSESYANPTWAAVLSAMFPGVGQIVTGQTKKGVIILAIFVVAVVGAALFHVPGKKSLPTIWYACIGLAIATWLGGILDATASAKRSPSPGGIFPKKKDPADRPVPPVNLPFE